MRTAEIILKSSRQPVTIRIRYINRLRTGRSKLCDHCRTCADPSWNFRTTDVARNWDAAATREYSKTQGVKKNPSDSTVPIKVTLDYNTVLDIMAFGWPFVTWKRNYSPSCLVYLGDFIVLECRRERSWKRFYKKFFHAYHWVKFQSLHQLNKHCLIYMIMTSVFQHTQDTEFSGNDTGLQNWHMISRTFLI